VYAGYSWVKKQQKVVDITGECDGSCAFDRLAPVYDDIVDSEEATMLYGWKRSSLLKHAQVRGPQDLTVTQLCLLALSQTCQSRCISSHSLPCSIWCIQPVAYCRAISAYVATVCRVLPCHTLHTCTVSHRTSPSTTDCQRQITPALSHALSC
jgi:hypothetical protein